MPPKGKLPAVEVAMLTQWVAMGAPWPAGPGGSKLAAGRDPAAEHWAFRPIRAGSLPSVKDAAWVVSPVDAFILARLEARGITPSPPADRRTLIRRATIDLWGMPPTPEEVEAFEADTSPDACAPPGRPPAGLAPVRRALGPALARRRPLRRHQGLCLHPGAPISVFVHLSRLRDRRLQRRPALRPVRRRAARRRPACHGRGEAKDTRPLAAMGFLTVGRRFLLDQNEIIDDRIDVVSRGLLGLTVTCARCHDHKFDPIPTDDYYSLYGVFASSVEPDDLPVLEWPAAPASRSAEFTRKLEAAKKARRLPGGDSRRDPEGLHRAVLALPEGGLRPEARRPQCQAGGAGAGRQAQCASAAGRDDDLAPAPPGDRRVRMTRSWPPGMRSPRCRRTASPRRPKRSAAS